MLFLWKYLIIVFVLSYPFRLQPVATNDVGWGSCGWGSFQESERVVTRTRDRAHRGWLGEGWGGIGQRGTVMCSRSDPFLPGSLDTCCALSISFRNWSFINPTCFIQPVFFILQWRKSYSFFFFLTIFTVLYYSAISGQWWRNCD